MYVPAMEKGMEAGGYSNVEELLGEIERELMDGREEPAVVPSLSSLRESACRPNAFSGFIQEVVSTSIGKDGWKVTAADTNGHSWESQEARFI